MATKLSMSQMTANADNTKMSIRLCSLSVPHADHPAVTGLRSDPGHGLVPAPEPSRPCMGDGTAAFHGFRIQSKSQETGGLSLLQ